jgi:hypothetical protein
LQLTALVNQVRGVSAKRMVHTWLSIRLCMHSWQVFGLY